MPAPEDIGSWIVGLAGGGLSLYALVRIFRKDSRNDQATDQIDSATRQIIATLRGEVERLTSRVSAMELEIVRLHTERQAYFEERAVLLAKLAECEGAVQTKLI